MDEQINETEREFLALVFNKPEVIDLLQIKPRWLLNEKNIKMLEYAVECYKNNKTITAELIYNLHKDFDIDYYVELYTEEMWYPTAWKNQLETSQLSILNHYKEKIITTLGEQLKRKQITYNTYMDSVRTINDITLSQGVTRLTKQEILECINEEKARINLNKFEKLNNILKMVQGDFVIIGATTGAGKSGLLINFMTDLMNTYQCIYFNMEMSKSTIYKRILALCSGIKVNDVEHPQNDYQRTLINDALNKIDSAGIIVEHKASSIVDIKSAIAKMKDKEKHTIVFIDHLGLIKIEGAKSLYEQATEVAKELRQICLEYDCTIISASQLNRGAYGSEEITLSMLKDSGELENSASKVLLLYKTEDAGKEDIIQDMYIDVAKNRDGYTGLLAVVYDKEKQLFKEKNNYS